MASDRTLDCIAESGEGARPIHAVRPEGLARLLEALPAPQAAFLRDCAFTGAAQELVLLPGTAGLDAAVLGLGDDRSPFAFGNLALRLPEASVWRLAPGDYDADAAVLGFCLGAYRFTTYKQPKRAPARLFAEGDRRQALAAAAATWMVRDLINTPANDLGPRELAGFAVALGKRYGAAGGITEGSELERDYPAVAAVGRGSARAPMVASFRWAGSGAHASAPLLSLCGKGVCFDTGGYDLKPSAGMLRMKKDMGGAATVLGLARLVMEADLPIRLAVRIGCVENAVSGTAMRPLDVLRTRAGPTVEVGNTDAEGRLVLCDLLAEAAEETPSLLVDCATLTGAARVALGPELPALFCNDDGWAEAITRAGLGCHDPVWRLPLWAGYDSWLQSPVADLNNVSSKPFAGAIVAALFLQRFVRVPVPWAHLDLYAWNDQTQPGRPEGGEAQAMRAIFAAIRERSLMPKPTGTGG
ncbi:MAG TPA: leucyl aminopeptidase family protein [Acetobacteraceae bacterium]|nr:leucyl aminopeptidase family protein [Acetobacteraceae bacterium]